MDAPTLTPLTDSMNISDLEAYKLACKNSGVAFSKSPLYRTLMRSRKGCGTPHKTAEEKAETARLAKIRRAEARKLNRELHKAAVKVATPVIPFSCPHCHTQI